MNMKNNNVILNDKSYHKTMIAIYDLMNKGEANLTDDDIKTLSEITMAAEKYEDEILGLKPVKKPQSLNEAIELFMFEHKLSQAKLATELGIGKPKLSQILTGKREPDVPFLKLLYNKLKLDPKFILEHV